jgi:hypothetical protein
LILPTGEGHSFTDRLETPAIDNDSSQNRGRVRRSNPHFKGRTHVEINEHYLKLQASYLISDIAKRLPPSRPPIPIAR